MKKTYYLTLVVLSITEWGFALPQGGQAVSGEAAIQHQLNNVQITTGDRAIINWSSFNIGKNETVQFVQPSSSSAVLNRDIGGMPSQIYGALQANGHVCLINQSGLIIGQGAAINAASFIASTLDILNDRFMKGEDLLFQNDAGGMIQLGSFTCEKGDIILVGRQIVSDGNIDIKEGSVSLGSGVDILVKPQGSEKIFIQPSQEEPQEGTGIDLKGTLTALQAELKADGNLYQMAIKNAAHVEAMTSIEQDGKIFLVAENGAIEVDGDLFAPGGEVRVLGDYVRLNKAHIDVSSDTKGGTVLVGGDFQGKNEDIYNAISTGVTKDATIKADAKINGDGGNVIVWSNEATGFYGNISAQGGPEGGDGGNVEVSGKYLDFQGLVSTLAPKGKTGTLLLDPVDVTIKANGIMDVNENFAVVMGTPTYTPAACMVGTIIAAGNLAIAWGANNVNVVTTVGFVCGQNGDIFVDPTAAALTLGAATPFTLTLTATRHIFVGATISDPTVPGGGGGIMLEALNGNVLVGWKDLLNPAPAKVIVGVANGTTTLLAHKGDIQIGFFGIPASFAAQVGWGFVNPMPGTALTGTLSATATLGSVFVQGGFGNTRAYSQLGHGPVGLAFGMQTTMDGVDDSGIIGSLITVIAGTDIQVVGGGNASECYAQIGHGGVDVNNITNPISSSISLDAGRDVILQGGSFEASDFLCYSQVGHMGGNDINSPAVRVSNMADTIGDILIGSTTPVRRVILEQGLIGIPGTRGWTHIGHGGDNIDIFGNVTGDITITTKNTGATAVTVLGAFGEAGWAQIGHGGGSNVNGGFVAISEVNFRGLPSTVSGDITISIPSTSGTLTLTGFQDPSVAPGANGIISYAQVGHGGAFARTTGSGGWTQGGGAQGIFIDVSQAFVTPGSSNILIEGGNCQGTYAQVGHGGGFTVPDFINAPITVNGTGIIISGATSGAGVNETPLNEVYAQIGHGGAGVAPGGAILDGHLSLTSGEIDGVTTVTVSNGIFVNGDIISNPTSGICYGQIGHGSLVIQIEPAGSKNPARHWGVHGDIDITCTGTVAPLTAEISLFGGGCSLGGGAWIGHGPVTDATIARPLAVTGNITINGMMDTDLSIAGGSAGAVNAIAAIGHGLSFTTDNVTVTNAAQSITANQIFLAGGLGSNNIALFYAGNAEIVSLSTAAADTQIITATTAATSFPAGTGAITLNGGNALEANAVIYTQGQIQTITGTSFIGIGGQASNNDVFVFNNNPAGTTTITATAGDVIFFNGINPSNNGATLQGNTGVATTIVQAAGDIVLADDINAGDNATGNIQNSLTFIADTDFDGFGAFKVDTSPHNILGMQTGNGVIGIEITTLAGAITIQSSQNFHGYGQVAADFQIGSPLDLTLLPNLYPAAIISQDFVILGGGGGPIKVDPSGAAFNFQAYRNIFVTSNGVSSFNSSVLLIAQKNIQIQNHGVVVGNHVTLVVDNQDPTSPNIGNGQFIIENGATLSSRKINIPGPTIHTPVLIFTARQSQNVDAGVSINGTVFNPGALFVNSAREEWCIYHPNGTGNQPFRIFYKDCLVIPPTAVTSNQASASQLFFYFDQWDHYLYWDRQFKVEYARDTFHYLNQIKWLTSLLEPYQKSHFFRSLLHGLRDQKPVWTFDVVDDRQLTLPPEWKADGTQYNTTVY